MAMRCLRWLIVVLFAAGCGAAVQEAAPTATPTPATLFCGKDTVTIAKPPSGPSKRFSKLPLLVKPAKVRVRGLAWGQADIGVVCGVRSAEHFATLVKTAQLEMHNGRPALRWTHKSRHYLMWLDRPGTAVFVGAPAAELDPIVKSITVGNPSGP